SDPAVGQQRPCDSDSLPPSRGETGFFQPDGFASFAGQTKNLTLDQDEVFCCDTIYAPFFYALSFSRYA
uniref:hypothetical protein n=1 Tax=Marinomonas sp. TaxID=1904862 RepID=UPI003A8DFE49